MKRILLVLTSLCVLLSGMALAQEAPTGGVASQEDMTDVIDIVDENMTPVTADMLNDGEYQINVDSSSSMFKIVGCALTVAGDTLNVRLYMKSEAYSFMYPGTAEEAAEAPADELSALTADDAGQYFMLPIEALDAGYTCAAYSARKEVWYPRTLVFRADSLPLEAYKAEYVKNAASLSLSDGEYTCEVTISGEGKAQIQSPAQITVSGGEAIARLVFSTDKIDYITVNGEKYLPAQTEGSAAFDVNIPAFGLPVALVVDSTAITPATEVPYSITFDPDTIK